MRSFAFCFRVSSNSTLCTLFAWSPSAARISSSDSSWTSNPQFIPIALHVSFFCIMAFPPIRWRPCGPSSRLPRSWDPDLRRHRPESVPWPCRSGRERAAEGPCAAAGPPGICIQYTKFPLGPTPSLPRSRIPEGLRPEETPRTVSAPFRRLLLRPRPKDLTTAVRRPGTGLLPFSPSTSTFHVRGEFGLHPIPSRVYGWRQAAGCGDARERGGRGAGKIDPPPKHNCRPGENSLLDRQRKKKLPIGKPP